MTDRHGTITLDCACCGVGIRIGATVAEDEQHVCKECGATCVVFLDEANDAYFGSWRCKHGVEGDEACDQCEAEEDAA